jgi:hypothetical protein
MASKKDDAGANEVQAKMDAAEEKGYFGEVPDATPNESYTVAGVTSGAPVPETAHPQPEARVAPKKLGDQKKKG